MTDLLHTLPGTLARVWDMLEAGVADRTAPARHPVLATVGQDGGAEARMVVLRGADRNAGTLEVHTDGASSKVQEIAASPSCSMLIWDQEQQLQIRLRTLISLAPGTPEDWTRIPDTARRAYGGTPAPGIEIADPADHDPTPDFRRFTILTARIDAIETLYLGPDLHRRAVFLRNDGFAGAWLAP